MVPHEQIKALELVPAHGGARWPRKNGMRLLTLPRMQKNNPPTHLIASTSGDYLRARLAIDGRPDARRRNAAGIEAPSARPRRRIIWLHPAKKTRTSRRTTMRQAATAGSCPSGSCRRRAAHVRAP